MIDEAARILHIMGVVVWIGHNWSNVVHTPVYRPILPAEPGAAAREVALAASKREHGIFRYSSVVVLATGLFMLWQNDILVDTLTFSGPSMALGLGAWLGLAMVLNLWGIMWPHQQKVLGFVAAHPSERLRCSRVTFLSSRMNTVLSVVTIMLMIAGAHGAL
ncbi:MAG: hypothetical protein KJ622_02840 [Alphaproteobacteria bacterium]|nr:hypothetical protein [Alphaproteobacteria bacterium]